jgi:hypothetical protein
MSRMLAASKQRLAQQDDWIKERRARIGSALSTLDEDFAKLLRRPGRASSEARPPGGAPAPLSHSVCSPDALLSPASVDERSRCRLSR